MLTLLKLQTRVNTNQDSNALQLHAQTAVLKIHTQH